MESPDAALSELMDRSDTARQRFFAHRDPGNLRPAEKRAFQYENMAFLLLWKAAQRKLEAELELQALLSQEQELF